MPTAPAGSALKSQTVATLMASFLGGFGAQRFYLGQVGAGIVSLLFFWTGIPGLIAFVETYLLAFMSQQRFADKYNGGQITPPTHVVAKCYVLIIPTLAVIGILAAIAIPAYQDYTGRARVSELLGRMQAAKGSFSTYLVSGALDPMDPAAAAAIVDPIKAGEPAGVVAEVGAFAYRSYADILTRVNVGNRTGEIYLVTNDGGASWECGVIGLPVRLAPKGCSESDSFPQRPEVEQRVGRWLKSFYLAQVEACQNAARTRGDAVMVQACECAMQKVASGVEQKEVSVDPLPARTLQLIQQAALSCRAAIAPPPPTQAPEQEEPADVSL